MDVIVGKGTEFKQYGIEIDEPNWLKTHPNGDGAKISTYAEAYVAAPHGETLTYHGQVKDGRKTLNSIATVGE